MKYAKTTEGQQAFKDRSVALSARQRSAFILFDGQRTVAEVLVATQGLGVTQEDVDYLVGMNLLAPVAVAAPAPAYDDYRAAFGNPSFRARTYRAAQRGTY